jgi:hypothetical protein
MLLDVPERQSELDDDLAGFLGAGDSLFVELLDEELLDSDELFESDELLDAAPDSEELLEELSAEELSLEELSLVEPAGVVVEVLPRLSFLKKPLPLKVTPTGWNTFLTAKTSPESGCSCSVRVSSWNDCWTSMVSPVSTNL